jgi:hypothetical protein
MPSKGAGIPRQFERQKKRFRHPRHVPSIIQQQQHVHPAMLKRWLLRRLHRGEKGLTIFAFHS